LRTAIEVSLVSVNFVAKFIDGKTVIKVIVVPNKLINIVAH
jgi:leucyl-tRNA synthetase